MIESRSIRNQKRSTSKTKRLNQSASRTSVDPTTVLSAFEKTPFSPRLKERRLKAVSSKEQSQEINFVALSSGLGFKAEASLSNNEFKSKASNVSDEDHERIISRKTTQRSKEISLSDAFSKLRNLTISPKSFLTAGSEDLAIESSTDFDSFMVHSELVEWEPARRTERVNAFLLDFILVSSVTVLFFLLGLSIGSGPGLREAFIEFQMATTWEWIRVSMMALAFVSFVFFVYFTACETYIGRSLGKWAFNLNVIKSDDKEKSGFLRIVLRNLAFAFGLLTGGLGLLWTFLDSRRRSWHDIISSTEVSVPVFETDPFDDLDPTEENNSETFQTPTLFL